MDRPFGLLALALWVVFFAVDAIWREYVHARSTGMTATVAGAVLAATGRLGPIRYLDFTASCRNGVGHHRHWHRSSRACGYVMAPTVDYTERTELARSGLFSVIRNPIFTFMTPNVVAMAGVVALWFGIELHVRRVEETY